MDYQFSCYGCGHQIAVNTSYAGSRLQCPSCNRPLTVPQPGAAARSPIAPVRPSPTPAASAGTRPPPVPQPPQGPQQQKALDYLRGLWSAGTSSAVMTDLRNLDLKAEVLPVSEHNLRLMKKDFIFWSLTLLAVVPLLLVTLAREAQLLGFCLFFAAIWGAIFKRFVVEDDYGSWRAPLAALFFTGLIGMNMLLLVYFLLPNFFLEMHDSGNAIVRLLGYVLQVGVFEELCKIAPVIAYIAVKKDQARPLTIILVGIFSGLGFAAFENLAYAKAQFARSVALTNEAGLAGLRAGVEGAMVVAMLRSMSLVFSHAVWSGIFAYFLAIGWLTRRRQVALGVVGLAVSAVLHGGYDWFTTVQPMLPAAATLFSFVLFYAYLTKLRLLMVSAHSTHSSQVVVP